MRSNLWAFLSGGAVVALASVIAFSPLATSLGPTQRLIDVVRSSVITEDGRAIFTVSLTSVPPSSTRVLEATAAFINNSGFISLDQVSKPAHNVPPHGLELRGAGWTAFAFPPAGAADWSSISDGDDIIWELIQEE